MVLIQVRSSFFAELGILENETLRQEVYRDFILGEFTEKQVGEGGRGGMQRSVGFSHYQDENKKTEKAKESRRLNPWHEILMSEYLARYGVWTIKY